MWRLGSRTVSRAAAQIADEWSFGLRRIRPRMFETINAQLRGSGAERNWVWGLEGMGCKQWFAKRPPTSWRGTRL